MLEADALDGVGEFDIDTEVVKAAMTTIIETIQVDYA